MGGYPQAPARVHFPGNRGLECLKVHTKILFTFFFIYIYFIFLSYQSKQSSVIFVDLYNLVFVVHHANQAWPAQIRPPRQESGAPPSSHLSSLHSYFVTTMAPTVYSAKLTLSCPLFAADFDPRNNGRLLVGGGGGEGRSGVGNKIASPTILRKPPS